MERLTRHLAYQLVGALLLASASAPSAAQQAQVALGSIRLLPGYVWVQRQGIDSAVGEISRKGHLTINYDIGKLAGNQAQSQKTAGGYLWYKEQVVRGAPVQIILNKKKLLVVTYPSSFANFNCQVKSEEDVADALLMLLTYQPKP